jgi:protein-S-isoprenylcysteine O-methyltransferase Ste14
MHRILRQWESPPTWLLLFVTIAWVQSRMLPVWDAAGLGNWLGAIFIVSGVGLLVVALFQFARARTTVMPRETARVLMTDGVYRLSRNPIYVADAMVLTGLCLRWDLGEEAGLRAKFGEEFHRWAEKTRRWL